MMHPLARKIGLGVVFTCSLSALALAQIPNVDTSKIDSAKANAQQAKTSAEESTAAAKEGTAAAKDTAGAVKKGDVAGVQEGAAKGQKKAKSAKTSGTKSTKKANDAAKDLTGK
jgi:hypothetical protein